MCAIEMKIKISIIFLVLTLAQTEIISPNNGYKCKLIDIPPTDLLHLPNVTEIASFVRSQLVPKYFLKDVMQSELRAFKDLKRYSEASRSPDVHMDIKGLIRKAGFPVEEHTVKTEDGYILTVHRIPGKGKPVFLMHGLLCSADDWVTVGQNNSLAYNLAEQGYDVWLGNARGTKHSMKHECIPSKCAEFWDFSWHEIGVYDLPAMIDYVLDKTSEKQLAYMGHSQGTTSVFVLLSERPEYNDKINIAVILSPVAWMSHLKSPVVRLVSLNVEQVYTLIGNKGINPKSPILRLLVDIVCANTALTRFVASNLIFLFFGYDFQQIDIVKLPVIGGHIPGGASTKQLVHYGQEIESAQFCKFDHGKKKNRELYGADSPPLYPVEKITAPTALFYSERDWFSNVTDVNIIRSKLPNVKACYNMETYNHIDYLYAKNLQERIFPKVLDLLRTYSD